MEKQVSSEKPEMRSQAWLLEGNVIAVPIFEGA